MKIYVNNKLQEIPDQAKITDTLDILKISSLKGIAIAVNNSVIPKTEWETHELLNNDKITLIQATQGG